MGLDMYLTGKRHLYKEADDALDEVSEKWCGGRDITCLTFELGYWRKANAIHGWFVNNVQGGKDDCGEYEVRYSDLVKLRQLCKEVLENGEEYALRFLPPASGFFFGTTDIGEYYWQYVKSTYELMTELCMDEDIQSGNVYVYYQSSW